MCCASGGPTVLGVQTNCSHPLRLDKVVAALVVVGLGVSIAAGVFLIDRPAAGDLPGIALGSEAILVVERIATLFTLWLLGLVVVARALAGELPIEISGRGVRYADVETAQESLIDSGAALDRFAKDLGELRAAVAVVERRQDGLSGRQGRYAMKGDGDEH